MNKYITNSIIGVIGLYVIFAGLTVATVVLEWATWDEASDWLVKIGVVALILLVINIVVAFLSTLLPHDKKK